MFQEIKKPLKGKVFHDLPPIEDLIVQEVHFFEQNPQKVKNLTAWHWIINGKN